jgi:hypothetical protein
MKLSATVKEAVADAEVEISQEEGAQARAGAPGPRTRQDCDAEQPDVCQRPGTYDHAIREFVTGYCSEPRLAFNRTVVIRYRIYLEQRGYPPATINLRLAVRRIAHEAAEPAS